MSEIEYIPDEPSLVAYERLKTGDPQSDWLRAVEWQRKRDLYVDRKVREYIDMRVETLESGRD